MILYELVHIVWSLSLIGQSMEKKYCLVFGKVLFLPQEPAIAKQVLLGLWKSIVPPSRTSYCKKVLLCSVCYFFPRPINL